jgi:putative hemolysin
MDASQPAVTAPMSAQSRTTSSSFAAGLRRTESLPQGRRSSVADPAKVSPDDAGAAAYCAQTGGHVYVRTPEYDTNGSQPLVLAGHASFCQYTSTADGSRIHILLTTLYSKKPSLAALAYILKPAIGSCNGNPASCYCTLLGGSDQFGGSSGAGGSWVNSNSEDQNLEACIFPDRSSIDSWGLTYHSAGIIRGVDLTTVMRYKYPG